MKRYTRCFCWMNMSRLLMWSLLVVMGCLGSIRVSAQQTFDVELMLRKKVNKANGTTAYDTIYAGEAHLFFNKGEAKKCVDGKSFTSNSYVDIDPLTKTWKFESVNEGVFIVVRPNMGEDMKNVLFEVKNGKTKYSYDYPADDGKELNGVQITSKRRVRVKGLKPGPPWEDGDKITWDIFSVLARSYMKKSCRFMFVPKAFEYPSNKFIQNIPPAVYDTETYMKAQKRRKSFDYEMNDSLVKYVLYERKPVKSDVVDSTLILNDSLFICKYRFVFKMPDVNAFYYYKAIRELEDYTHVYFADTTTSSYLRKKPWRFLATDFAVQYGDLADSLYVNPKVQVRNEPRTLALVFKNNTARLEDTEKNDSILAEVKSDMRTYRNSLQQVTIVGSASPEGSRERNVQLANERAAYAVSLLRSIYPGVNVRKGDPIVYEWSAVTDRLREMGRLDIVNAIEARISSGGKVTRDIMEWTETIEPILSELRAMNCTYTIRLNKPLEPEQAVDKFLHDPDFAEGGSKSFSLGDYFNIYKYCKDTLAMEKLTERIYRTEIKPHRDNARYQPFYAYVANRHLADKLKHGTVDKDSPGILAGFVNLDTLRGGHLYSDINGCNTRDKGRTFKINRSDHVANLALAYFNMKKYSLADTLSQLLPSEPMYDKKYKAVRMLTLLCSRFIMHPEEAEPGLDYAWNASPLSRAVLAVELKEKLDPSRTMPDDSLSNLLWSLPDAEPRKWYLLALTHMKEPPSTMYANPYASVLKEKRAEMMRKEDEHETDFNTWMHSDEYAELERAIDSLKRLSDEAGEPSLKDSLPDYCAYLQHAFDLDSSYYLIHYWTDYDFDEYVREQKQSKQKNIKERDYKYLPKLAPYYRRRFEDIVSYYRRQYAYKPADAAPDHNAGGN